MRFLTAFLLGVVGLVGMSSNVVRADNIGLIPGSFVPFPGPGVSIQTETWGQISDGVWQNHGMTNLCSVRPYSTGNTLFVACRVSYDQPLLPDMSLSVDQCRHRIFAVGRDSTNTYSLSCDSPYNQPLPINWALDVPSTNPCTGGCTADFNSLTCTQCGNTGATLSLNTANCFLKMASLTSTNGVASLSCTIPNVWNGNYTSQCESCEYNHLSLLDPYYSPYPQDGQLKCTCSGVTSVLSTSTCPLLLGGVDPLSKALVCSPPVTVCPTCAVCPTQPTCTPITPCPTYPPCATCPACVSPCKIRTTSYNRFNMETFKQNINNN